MECVNYKGLEMNRLYLNDENEWNKIKRSCLDVLNKGIKSK